MALDFPSSPALNDEYTSAGKTWRFNGVGWDVVISFELDALTDVEVSTVSDGQVIRFDDATDEWVPTDLGDLAALDEADLLDLATVPTGDPTSVIGVEGGDIVQSTVTSYGLDLMQTANRAGLMSYLGLTFADLTTGISTLVGGGVIRFEQMDAGFLASFSAIRMRGAADTHNRLTVSPLGISFGSGSATEDVAFTRDAVNVMRITNGAGGAGFVRSTTNDTHLDGFTRRGELPNVREVRRTGALTQTLPRWAAVGNIAALTSGTLLLCAVTLLAGETVNSITWFSRTTPGAGMTNQWFCLVDSSLVVRAVSADDTSTAWTASVIKTLNMTTPYVIPSDGVYYLGIMVAGTTPPSLAGVASASAMFTNGAPFSCATSTAGMTTPPVAGVSVGALTAVGTGTPMAYVS